MTERWMGIVVASTKVVIVDVEVPSSGPLTIQADDTWDLQDGNRPDAYKVMHQRVADYVRDHKVSRVIVKESALSIGGTTKAHLEACELRGVVMCAAASAGATTETIAKALVSRTFGKRKVDEYVKDHKFWAQKFKGIDLRAGSREAAMVLLAAKKTR